MKDVMVHEGETMKTKVFFSFSKFEGERNNGIGRNF